MKKYLAISILILTVLVFNIITNTSKENLKSGFPDDSYVTVSEPFTFQTEKAELLSVKAFDLKKRRNYYEAILLYREALEIEPDNPKLFFDLADCYSNINSLEYAVLLLDTAIILENSYAPFYNNRGLYYYNLIITKRQ